MESEPPLHQNGGSPNFCSGRGSFEVRFYSSKSHLPIPVATFLLNFTNMLNF